MPDNESFENFCERMIREQREDAKWFEREKTVDRIIMTTVGTILGCGYLLVFVRWLLGYAQ